MNPTYDTGGYYAALFGALTIYFLIFAVVYVVQSIIMAAMFQKAGIPAWKAWVPFVNIWALLEMGGQKGWYTLFVLVPIVGPIALMVFQIIALVEINRRFRQPGGMLALAILVPVVYFGIMGYGSAQWHGPMGGGMSQDQYAAAPSAYGYNPPSAPYNPPSAPYVTSTPYVAPAPYVTPTYETGQPADSEGTQAVDANISAGGLTAILVSDLTPYEGKPANATADNVADALPIITSIAGSFGSREANSPPILVVLDAVIAEDEGVSQAKQYIDTYGDRVNARTIVVG